MKENPDRAHRNPHPRGHSRGREYPPRPATAADADAVIDLFGHIDLHRPAEEGAALLDQLRFALAQVVNTGNHFLVAQSADGTPVGALHCGPALWMFEHPRIPDFMRPKVLRRITALQHLAVRPDHRGRGMGSALVHRAEEDLRRMGFAAVTLRHERGLERFYRPLGYTSTNRLALNLPPVGLITEVSRGWKQAVKPLGPDAYLTPMQGFPTLTGIFGA